MMQHPRDEFLAGAILAADEHRARRGGGALDDRQHALQCDAAADDVVGPEPHARLAPQRQVLVEQLLVVAPHPSLPPAVLDRHPEQLREALEQRALGVPERLGAAGVIQIDRAHQARTHEQRHAQYRAQAERDHALRQPVALAARVTQHQRAARLTHTMDDVTTVGQRVITSGRVDGPELDHRVQRHIVLVVVSLAHEQQHATLGVELLDRQLHGLRGELFEVRHGVQQAAHRLQQVPIVLHADMRLLMPPVPIDRERKRLFAAAPVAGQLVVARGGMQPIVHGQLGVHTALGRKPRAFDRGPRPVGGRRKGRETGECQLGLQLRHRDVRTSDGQLGSQQVKMRSDILAMPRLEPVPDFTRGLFGSIGVLQPECRASEVEPQHAGGQCVELGMGQPAGTPALGGLFPAAVSREQCAILDIGPLQVVVVLRRLGQPERPAECHRGRPRPAEIAAGGSDCPLHRALHVSLVSSDQPERAPGRAQRHPIVPGHAVERAHAEQGRRGLPRPALLYGEARGLLHQRARLLPGAELGAQQHEDVQQLQFGEPGLERAGLGQRRARHRLALRMPVSAPQQARMRGRRAQPQCVAVRTSQLGLGALDLAQRLSPVQMPPQRAGCPAEQGQSDRLGIPGFLGESQRLVHDPEAVRHLAAHRMQRGLVLHEQRPLSFRDRPGQRCAQQLVELIVRACPEQRPRQQELPVGRLRVAGRPFERALEVRPSLAVATAFEQQLGGAHGPFRSTRGDGLAGKQCRSGRESRIRVLLERGLGGLERMLGIVRTPEQPEALMMHEPRLLERPAVKRLAIGRGHARQ